MPAILVPHAGTDPLILEVGFGATAVDLAGPPGTTGEAAVGLVRTALDHPPGGPPLAAHAVPGDRVAVALAGAVPQPTAVIAALRSALATVDAVAGAPVVLAAHGADAPVPGGATAFTGRTAAETAYLTADEAGRPLYLARALVDADLVVEVASWHWDAALHAADPTLAVWPAFGRAGSATPLERRLARRGRKGLEAWTLAAERMRWHLGVTACLRLVPGRDGTLLAACFGAPSAAAAAARTGAMGWRPRIAAPAALAVATLSPFASGVASFTRAVAAAARVTTPDGTICVIGDVAAPGPVFRRWREGVAIRALVTEAVAGRDPALVADAVQARLFARALGSRRLVLLSSLDAALVEELDFGNARSPEAIERLAARAASLVVLREADLLWPRHPGG